MENPNTNRLLNDATQAVAEVKSVHFIREAWPPVGYVGKIDVPAGLPDATALDKAFTAFNEMDGRARFEGPSASVGDTFVIEQGSAFQAHRIARFGFNRVENPQAVAQARYARNLEILKPDKPRSPEEEGRMIKALIENHTQDQRPGRER